MCHKRTTRPGAGATGCTSGTLIPAGCATCAGIAIGTAAAATCTTGCAVCTGGAADTRLRPLVDDHPPGACVA